jgi:type IV pilus biogenesis protein CpaD/CtpE
MSASLLQLHQPEYNFQSIKNAYDAVNLKVTLSYTLKQLGLDLFAGKIGLYMSNDTLLIVRIDNYDVGSKKIMFIILAYSVNGDALEMYRQQVRTLAKELGCSTIQWQSPRMYTRAVEGSRVKEWLYELDI